VAIVRWLREWSHKGDNRQGVDSACRVNELLFFSILIAVAATTELLLLLPLPLLLPVLYQSMITYW